MTRVPSVDLGADGLLRFGSTPTAHAHKGRRCPREVQHRHVCKSWFYALSPTSYAVPASAWTDYQLTNNALLGVQKSMEIARTTETYGRMLNDISFATLMRAIQLTLSETRQTAALSAERPGLP